ncbi:MAG: glutamine--fructose-6-phosphate transaminase (isomerizing) [Patescibacteria group bacterium]|jgi:glucosamine--fructose-6-phosphate aminotransferase (isomerizing)
MCGIIGYVGNKKAAPILIEGLKKMEYRGYDSAGVAIIHKKGKISCHKKKGKISNLEKDLPEILNDGSIGIAHTRWATHGAPSDLNAHPHAGCDEELYLVHNGIIENYYDLKKQLISEGHKIKTQTDTEILVHLVEKYYKKHKPLETAVMKALGDVVGTYGLAVVSSSEPNKIVAARLGSPLVLGVVKDGEYIVASDVTALLKHTRQVIYMEDREIVTITPKGFEICTLDNKKITKSIRQIEWDMKEAEKQGHPHFMFKEIMEQPHVVQDAMRGRLITEEGLSRLGGFMEQEERLRKVKRIVIVACGTAYYAGLVGEYMIEEYAGIPTEVDFASEFRYKKPVINGDTAVIIISQSGETADTLAALRESKRKGALVLGIVNVVGSTIAREVDAGAYSHAGPEIGVASTKAFMSQLTVLVLVAMYLGRQRGMSLVTGKRIGEELKLIPDKIKKILKQNDDIKKLAKKYYKYKDFLYLGRKYNYAIAYEGALKLKEISYIHSEGFGSGEMKHGPIALIDENFPTLMIVPQDSVYEKNMSNLQEVKARGGKIIAIATEGDKEIKKLVDDVIYIPKTLEMLTPMLTVIPLQLFAYHCAVLLKRNVDQPRNLAKSVTVE